MNGTEFNDDDCAAIPLWAKDHPKTWLVYMVVDHILWLEHEAPDVQRVFQESKMFFKDPTLLEDPLSKGFAVPDLLKRLRERAHITNLAGNGPYYIMTLHPCSRTLMCDVCYSRIENPIDQCTTIWFSPFTQDLRCTNCLAIENYQHGELWVCYPSRRRTIAWQDIMESDRQPESLYTWKLNNPRSWLKFFVLEHLLWQHHSFHAQEISNAFYKDTTLLNRLSITTGINGLCVSKFSKTVGRLMEVYGHPFSPDGDRAFKIQFPDLAKQLRCDRCLEFLKGPTVSLTIWPLNLYCPECLPLETPMIFYAYDDAAQRLSDKITQQIDQDRILAEKIQKELGTPGPAAPSPTRPNPSPLPASDNNQAALNKTSHEVDDNLRDSKRIVQCQLQSTVVRSETLITGAFDGPRWFAFKMYEHASLLIPTNRTVQEIEEEWESWPDNTLRLMRFYAYDDAAQRLSDKITQQIDQDRILAEKIQKELGTPGPAAPSPTRPNPSPLPASDNNQAALNKTSHEVDDNLRDSKRIVQCQLQSTVVRSETLITGAFDGPRWFAFKMYEHASLLIPTNRTVQEIEEEWESWPDNTLRLMRAVYELLGRASVQLPLPFRLPSGEFQRCILIQNQTQRAYCSQYRCPRGLLSIGELVYVSVLDLETFCFLCGPPYKDGHTIIYHPSRLLPKKPQQPAIQQSLARLAIQDDSSLSTPKRQKSSEGDETESNTSPRDKMEVSEPDSNTCVICLEEKATWALVPCGHMHYCGECIKLVTKCASCRASIQMRVRIYNS